MAPSGTRDLLAAVARGDASALNDLMARQLPMLRAWVRLRMGSMLAAREAPTDIVQSACREVIEDLSQLAFRSEGHFRRTLFQAAGRKLIDRARFHGADKRSAGRDAGLASGEPEEMLLSVYASVATPSAEAIGHEFAARIECAFADLDDEERELIIMAKVEELTVSEIAQQQGRSEGAVRTALYRALRRLSGLLGYPSPPRS